MKFKLWPYLIAPFVVLTLVLSFKAFSQSPFEPWVKNLNGAEIGNAGSKGNYLEKVAIAKYDPSVQGGSVAGHGLGVTLPAGAIITQDWYLVTTQFTDSGSGTIALSCEDANNILTSGDITGISANTITTGASTGSAATMVRAIAAPCEITATVGGVTSLTGALTVFVRYIVGE